MPQALKRARILLLMIAVCAVPIGVAAQTGVISGRLTVAGTSTPIASANVFIYRAPSTFAATTNATGDYTVSGLATGSYYAFTSNSSGFINEIFDNIQCPGSCSVTTATSTGTAIAVTSGLTTANVSFALEVGGIISGTITNAATTTAIQSVSVLAYLAVGNTVSFAGQGVSNASGAYQITGLPTGNYLLFTSNSVGFINEIFDNVACPGFCSTANLISSGTPTAATAGTTVTGRNFALDVGATISGTVTNSATSTPIASVSVFAALVSGNSILIAGSGFTNASGAYSIVGLPAGTYYVFTSTSAFINEIYNNVQCVGGCSPTVSGPGTPIAVTVPGTVPGIDFVLDVGGTISGTVTTSTGAPVASWFVNLFAGSVSNAIFAGSASTNATGHYQLSGLPTGTYRAYTSGSSQNLVNEVYDNVQCPGQCSTIAQVFSGTGISVTAGATTADRNFILDAGGSIAGTLANATGPIAGSVNIYTRVAGLATFSGSASVNSSGNYAVTGFPTGTYYALASSAGYLPEIYDNVPCLGSCSTTVAVSAGAPIAVTGGVATTGRNFVLDLGGTISGTITNAATTTPLAGVSVSIYTNSGSNFATFVGSASTNASGIYTSSALPAGNYYALTSNSAGFTNQIYNGIVCPGFCSSASAIATGTAIPVTVGAASTGRNFALSAGGSISGTVTNASTSALVVNAGILIYSRVGDAAILAGSTVTAVNGTYTVSGLASGTYYALTSVGGFANKIFDLPSCATTCSSFAAVTQGTAISVTAGSTTTGRNFSLSPFSSSVPDRPGGLSAVTTGASAAFSWFAPSTSFGGAATSYILEIGFSPGTTVASFTSTTTSRTVSGVPPGRYYARVKAVNASGTGLPSLDYLLIVGGDGNGVPDAPFGLTAYMVGDRLYASWAAPTTGGTATSYLFEAGTSSGSAGIASLPVTGPTFFTFQPVPPGFYFLRVRASNVGGTSLPSNEVMLNVGGVPAPPDPPLNFNGAANAARTVTFGWTPPRGTVTGYIVAAGSAPGLSDIAVLSLGPATTFAVPNVPPGRYWVRLRAVGPMGTSIESGEVVLTVQ